MRHPTGCTLATTLLWAASSLVTAAADGTVTGASPDAQGGSSFGHSCHRSFPAFLWAGTQTGEQRQTGYQHAVTDVHDIASMVVDAASVTKDLEVVVIVLSKGNSFSTASVSEANAAGGSDAALHARSATTTFPYAYPSSTAVSKTVPLLAAETGALVQEAMVEEAVSSLVDSGVLSDGKLDFAVVIVPEANTIEETDAAVRGLTTKLEEGSNGRFMLLWTGDFHGEDCGRRSLGEQSRRRLQAEASTTTTSRTIKMTPDILSGLLVLLLFLFIVMTGLGCVGDIECPQSFATVNPAKGREY